MEVIGIIVWILCGVVGVYLVVRDWTKDFDMYLGHFLMLCLLIPTGPFCLLFGIVAGGPYYWANPIIFKKRSDR